MVEYDSLEAAIKGCFGDSVKETKRSYIAGGDINDATCLQLSNGERVFVKSNALSRRGFFDAEEAGLSAIASTGAIGTPKLLCKGTDAKRNISFLMMEMIEPGKKVSDYWELFAKELANMHKADTSRFVADKKYGFLGDNYIGASAQHNKPMDSWVEFFRQQRLEVQFKMAEKYFDREFIKETLRFLDKTEDILTEPDFPSLLHGDLWSGNSMTGNDGKAILIDPACYVGHAEADIAMTELFGRLPKAFYEAYNSQNQLHPGYEDRREIYNLYHLLNHLNLFGSSYLYPVQRTVRRYSS